MFFHFAVEPAEKARDVSDLQSGSGARTSARIARPGKGSGFRQAPAVARTGVQIVADFRQRMRGTKDRKKEMAGEGELFLKHTIEEEEKE
jgi:hypothetical protein